MARAVTKAVPARKPAAAKAAPAAPVAAPKAPAARKAAVAPAAPAPAPRRSVRTVATPAPAAPAPRGRRAATPAPVATRGKATAAPAAAKAAPDYAADREANRKLKADKRPEPKGRIAIAFKLLDTDKGATISDIEKATTWSRPASAHTLWSIRNLGWRIEKVGANKAGETLYRIED